MDMHHTFVRREEWRAAHESEVEFTETARALRALARELGAEPEALIHTMTAIGLSAALGQLSQAAGSDVETRFQRHRAVGRS
jgi:hypothetical protein